MSSRTRPHDWRTPAAWAVGAILLFGLLTWLDALGWVIAWNRSMSVWLQGPDMAAMTDVSSGIDWLFSGQVVIVLALLAIGALWLAGDRTAAISLGAIFPLIAVEVVLKFGLHRPAPEGILAARKLFNVAVGPDFLRFSFPSGHAARATFLIAWLVLWLLAPRLRPFALGAAAGLIGFICWSRIYAGDHWLLDVIGGMLLATAFLAAAALAAPLVLRILNKLGLGQPGTTGPQSPGKPNLSTPRG